MKVISGILDRIDLLPWFINYYESIGATTFIFAVHRGYKNTLMAETDLYKGESFFYVRPTSMCHISEMNALKECEGVNRIREEFVEPDEWVCYADVDEFAYFGGKTLDQVAVENCSADAIHGTVVDRISRDGSFPELGGDSLDTLFPKQCRITGVAGANTNKVILAKGSVEIGPAHHYCKAATAMNVGFVHHFKWHSGALKTLAERYKYYTAQGLSWAGESKKILDMAINGMINIQDPALEVTDAAMIGI